MSKGIKTKTTIKDVKALDKGAVAAERMKQAFIRTKDKAEHGLYAEENSPGEYAADRVSYGVDSATHEAVRQFDKQGREYRPPKRISLRSRRTSKSGNLPLNSLKNKQKRGRHNKPGSLLVTGMGDRRRILFLSRLRPLIRSAAPLRRWIAVRKVSRRWIEAERPSNKLHPPPKAL